MSAIMIDGKAVAERIKAGLKVRVEKLQQSGKTPGLAVILVGSDPASRVYVNMKKKACAALGIYSEEYALAENTTETELLKLINDLNNNPNIHGILLQLPLPGHLDENKMLEAISPLKDVDGFHPVNVGKLMTGIPGFLPCTPAGVMDLIRESGISIAGKECVVVGRSNIVGKPQAILLLREHGTVTICHSRTPDLASVCRRADILVAAVGKAGLITAEMVKPGAVVIDVGVNRTPDGKLVGDVDFDQVYQVAGWITPVPGGVGPMTIAKLMENTVISAEN
ncbi:MAG TPA: bifunctional methylenetetrahydrofolate dehydrogenase/methenyltetrahydrofolate cyclohydrolase FolD [Bacillota bacterium]|jgi:methylenetetrahydrofolate dehydrogenase (NADP+)/methenyltetrahydrofolate cyclohydrolase|nr:bifunctional methylenetetrahydrofolate dehydrogenase/methenyltetrahydrofolate cyclohydrolase FolD [Bacillota bacterium]HOL09486.1 bifunctional methylenetetrahydrofolate dehydrogenase/methenyltetrahydrofolate cyclohydrolase FolD [Bacillota bacterium]HPO97552.1 bifunctional methylenetetrahydrofolate dehydrogenase/methenyltetrahydrofolate cyclohydrolase FolD [Bacillota bacterium]